MKNRLKYLLLAGLLTVSSTPIMSPSVVIAADNKETDKDELEEDDDKKEKSSEKETEARVEVVKEVKSEPETEPPVETEEETEEETESPVIPDKEDSEQTESEVITEPETESPTEDKTEQESESDSESESETGSESEGDSETESEKVTEEESESEVASETESESESETESESEKESETEKKQEEEKKEDSKDKEDVAANYQRITGEPVYVLGSYPVANIGENTNLIYDFLTKKMGLNHAAACGVLANIQCESNFSSTALGDGGTSYGLCQWHLERFSALILFCNANGYDFHMLEGQLEYLYRELQGGYSDVLSYLMKVPNNEDGAYQAAAYWCRHFEMPSHMDYNCEMRGDLARNGYFPKQLGIKNVKKEHVKVYSAEPTQAEVIVMEAPEDLQAVGVQKAVDTLLVDAIINNISEYGFEL